jgi:hypothetical protein
LRNLLFIFSFFIIESIASADPSLWVWYPHHRPYPSFGRNVKLSDRGLWVHKNEQLPIARVATHNVNMIDPRNSDQRNGRLAYEAAYSAYKLGKAKGTNKINLAKGGRWKKKITTERGIVLLTDDWSNVAVRAPDGKWHVIDEKGSYAATSTELPGDPGEPEMVASVFYPSIAPVKPTEMELVGPGGLRSINNLSGSPNRMPASLAVPEYAD